MAPATSDSCSESSSDNESEAGRSANASVARTSLAVLRARHLQPLIQESNWHNNHGPDFQQRNVERQYRFTAWQNGVPRAFSAAKSDTSSMAVCESSASSVNSYSKYAPSLVDSYSTLQSSSFGSSDRRGSFFQPYALNEDGEDVTQFQDNRQGGRLACCFSFLACQYRSDDLEEWETHCQSHFHGCLPSTISCPFHCDWSKTAANGERAWQECSVHIRSRHDCHDEVDTERVPELSLLQHLWGNRIIETAQFQELRSNGRLTGTQVFTRPAGTLRESRRERRQRGSRRT